MIYITFGGCWATRHTYSQHYLWLLGQSLQSMQCHAWLLSNLPRYVQCFLRPRPKNPRELDQADPPVAPLGLALRRHWGPREFPALAQ